MLSSRKANDAVSLVTFAISVINLFLVGAGHKLANERFGKNTFGLNKLNRNFKKDF